MDVWMDGVDDDRGPWRHEYMDGWMDGEREWMTVEVQEGYLIVVPTNDPRGSTSARWF